MSRYRGPRLRIIRRLGELPGLTRKNVTNEKPPGEHGAKLRKPSEYAKRLQEKQKLRYNYGVSEKQLLRYVKLAKRMKSATGEVLLQLLEMRLDNTIFRLGMAPTIPAARQLVNHGHVYVNDRRVSICSFQMKPGDIITIADNEKSRKLVLNHLESPGLANVPGHLELDKKNLSAKINSVVSRDWVALKLEELLVVEYYSRK